MTVKTIHEIADELNISVRTLNRLAKSGYLVHAAGKRPLPAQMTQYLRKGRMLTVEHILLLSRDPAAIEGLGELADVARRQMKAIGDIPAGALHGDCAAWITGAAMSDPATLPRFAEWLSGAIPAKGCGYHYLACRALWNVPEARFKEYYSRIAKAILNARRHYLMEGQSETIKSVSRFFPKPEFDQ